MAIRDEQVQSFRLDMSEYHNTFYSRPPTFSEDPKEDVEALLERYCAATALFKYQMSPRGMKRTLGIKTYAQIQEEGPRILAEIENEGIQEVCLKYHVPEGFLRDTYEISGNKPKKKSRRRKKKSAKKQDGVKGNGASEPFSLEDRLPRRDVILDEMADNGIQETAANYGASVDELILRRSIKQRDLAGVLGLPKINIPVEDVMRATGLSGSEYIRLFPHALRV